MTFVYIVRCNFIAPAKEAAWNAWYSGPKIAQMLTKPHFRSCQRFHRTAGAGRNYLALWTLTTPEAFQTAAYKADWGFSEWTPDIADWSRDLFDGGDAETPDFAVGAGGALSVIAFDGLSADQADAARRELAPSRPDTMWLPIAGLDRHTPLIGLARQAGAEPAGQAAAMRGQHALYRPISEFHTAG